MRKTRIGLSAKGRHQIVDAFAKLSDDQANQVAVLLAERGPLAGALAPEGEEYELQTRDEVVHLVGVVFDQHVLEATEEDREESDLCFLFEAVFEVQQRQRAPSQRWEQ